MKELAGKTAFVTGAASGIGLGIATALSQAGVKVMLCDIEEAALAKAIADLRLTNADVDSVRADASLKVELQAAANATVARYGNIHILVNNAGVGGGGGYGRWTDASWNWTLGVNLMSVHDGFRRPAGGNHGLRTGLPVPPPARRPRRPHRPPRRRPPGHLCVVPRGGGLELPHDNHATGYYLLTLLCMGRAATSPTPRRWHFLSGVGIEPDGTHLHLLGHIRTTWCCTTS